MTYSSDLSRNPKVKPWEDETMSAKVLSFPCRIEPLDVLHYFVALDTLANAVEYLREQHRPNFTDFANWDARSILIEALRKVLDAQEAYL